MRRRVAHLVLLPILTVGAGLGGCLGQDAEETVSVLASWTGAEEAIFRKVLDAFTDRYGIRVDYQGTRAVRQILFSEVQKGTPPDIAVLPTLSELAAYLRQGALKPLDSGSGSPMSQQWRELAQLDDNDDPDVVPVKADLKSLVWYVPGRLPLDAEGPPRSWEKLVETSRSLAGRGATPWCLGMGATPGSGWPGTDWIEDILLHRSGVDIYQRWSAGTLAWNSPEVAAAWRIWGGLVAAPGMVRGGATAALLTEFSDAGRPMFAAQPGCLLHHQASFVIGIHQGYAEATTAPAANADYFPFPVFAGADVGADAGTGRPDEWVVSADLAGLFTEKPQARKLIEFLATDEAQQIWPDQGAGSVFSVNENVDLSGHGEVSGRIAQTLTAGRSWLCFDASDVMPTRMANAFQHAVLEYLRHPDRLVPLLDDLERIRLSAEAGEWLRLPCSKPSSEVPREGG